VGRRRVEAANPGAAIGPFGVNLIVHPSNSRLRADAELVVRHRVPLVITSVGPPGRIVEAVHGYGGLVFHDVTNVRHAKKAISEGVDGLILVAAGAGGHAGTASPFALTAEVREFYDGPLVLAGAISHGHQVRAAQIMGADLAYLGTRFIATEEANAAPGYKQMIVDDDLKDLIYSPAFTGIPANYLRRSVEAAGIDPNAVSGEKPDVGLDLAGKDEAKAWKDIWSAGQGIGTIKDVLSVAGLVERLASEYASA